MASILVVNDIPGTGQVAGLTNLAVLNAAGYEVTLLPTVYLTHHTGRWPVYRESLDAAFSASLMAWRQVKFQAIVTGYFGNASQIHQFVNWYKHYQADTFLVVDPIMGDRGQLYTGLDQDYVAAMQELVALADYALPNLTEAYLLAGLDAELVKTQEDKQALETLANLESKQKSWVITGIEVDDQIGVAFESNQEAWTQRQNCHLFGTGDFFTSCFLACQVGGLSLEATCQWCVDLVGRAVENQGLNQAIARQELYYQPYLPFISKTLRKEDSL